LEVTFGDIGVKHIRIFAHFF